jgi:hypothetical protein
MRKKEEKSVHEKPRRGRGRPPGQNFVETIPVRLTSEAAKAIAAWCRRNKVTSRSKAIRTLLDKGLER